VTFQTPLIFFVPVLTLANRRLIMPVGQRNAAVRKGGKGGDPRDRSSGIPSVGNQMWNKKMSQTDKMALFGSALLLIAIVGLGFYGLNRAYSYGDEGPTDISAQSRQ
jgi:hypothetical protein